MEKYIFPFDPVSRLLLCSDRSNSLLVRSISGTARQQSRIICFKIKIYQAAVGGLSVRGGKSLPRTSGNTPIKRPIKNIFIHLCSNSLVQTWPPRHRQQSTTVIWLSQNRDVTEERSGCSDSIWKPKQAAALKPSAQVMHKHTLTCSSGSHSSALHTRWHPLATVQH